MSRSNAVRLCVLALAGLGCVAACGAAHAVAFGYVQTVIQPPEAAAAGAQWRVDGGAWQDSGATVEVSSTTHTVSFKSVPGWRTPPAQSVGVPNMATITVTGTYSPYALCEGVGACNRPWLTPAFPPAVSPWFVQEAVSHDGHNALQSGPVAADQMSNMTTFVTGPCTVTFWWKASCSDGWGQFFYEVDATRFGTLTGETDWVQAIVPLGPGTHQIAWFFYRGPGDPGAGSNCGWVDQFVVQESTPPTGSVSVEGGAARTNNPNVLLDLTSDDGDGAGVSGVRFSNNGSTWSAWEKPAAQKVWTLAPGDGVKTVRAQFRDKAGNVSAVYTDTILLDQTPPAGAIVINNGAPTTDALEVVLNLFWVDHGSGVSRMRFSSNGYTWSAWEPVASTKPWTLPGWGYHTLRVQYLDRAGNASPVFRWTTKAVE